MPGPIILSNRLARLQQSMSDFGDTFEGLRKAQKESARQDQADKMAQESHAAQMRAATNQDTLQGFALRRAGQEEQDASALRSDQNELAAVDSGLPTFGPRMPADETPTPFTDQNRNLRARLMASIESKISGKPVSVQDIHDRADAKRLAKDEASFDLGEKKNKATRDAAKSDQDIKESKARTANYYAGAEKDRKAAVDGKQPSKEQFDAAGFGRRMEQASNVFDKLAAGGYNRGSKSAGIGAMMPNLVKGKESQQQDQAERNFINATLRRESGAAISPSEFENAEKQYFPRAGDSQEVIQQKRENRMQVMESMRAASGKAWEQVKPMGSKAMTVGKYSIEVEE